MFTRKNFLLIAIPIVFIIALASGLANPAQAVEFDEDGFVGADEVIDDDLFIASDMVEINGTINGDVFAAGSVVEINGTVNGSLVTGAQSIQVNGEVEGSVYAGSSTLTLGSEAGVGRNLYFGGFNLTTNPGSRIEKDLLVGAYQALLSGTVGRNVQAGAGAVEIDGTIGGDVYAAVDSPDSDNQMVFFGGPPGVDRVVPTGLRVSEQAEIGGRLTYESSQEQEDAIQAAPGEGIVFKFSPERAPEADAGDFGREIGEASTVALIVSWIGKRLQAFVTLLLLGGLLIWQLPNLLRKVSDKVETKTMPALGWGLVTWVVVYVGAFVAAGLIIAAALFFGVVTLGGLSRTILAVGFSSLGLTLAGFGLLVSYISKLVVALIIGKLLLKWLAPKYADQLIWPLVVGILIYTLLRAVPILGWFIGAAVTLIGIGAMWLTYREKHGTREEVLEEAAPEQTA